MNKNKPIVSRMEPGAVGEVRVSNRRAPYSSAQLYLNSLGAKSSRDAMRRNIVSLAKIVAPNEEPLSDFWDHVRKHHVDAIMTRLSETQLSHRTQTNYLMALKGICKASWINGTMSSEDYEFVKMVKPPRGASKPRGRALELEELRALFRACGDDEPLKGARDLAILTVLASCGLRRAEVVGLTVRDFDRKAGSLGVVGKGNKYRWMPLHKIAVVAVERWLELSGLQDEEPLFVRIAKGDKLKRVGMTGDAVYKILKKRQADLGLEPLSPHDFRRTFATMTLENSVDLFTLQALMGHASLTTTKHYDLRDESGLRSAVDGLEF